MKINEILRSLKTNEFMLNSTIPMDYTPGIPMASICNGEACLVIPYVKYKITGEIDKTQVFAPRFVVVITIKKGIVVKYEDLSFDSRFEEVDFRKPIGLFRHTAIRHLKKNEYVKMRDELYDLIDGLCASMSGKMEFDEMDAMRLCKLYAFLLEPSLRPFYHAINKSFFETYIK